MQFNCHVWFFILWTVACVLLGAWLTKFAIQFSQAMEDYFQRKRGDEYAPEKEKKP